MAPIASACAGRDVNRGAWIKLCTSALRSAAAEKDSADARAVASAFAEHATARAVADIERKFVSGASVSADTVFDPWRAGVPWA